MKFNLFALLLIVAFIYASYGADTDGVVRRYQGIDVYKPERACSQQGGLCVHARDCQMRTAISGLCPENAHRGVECCYEVKQSEAVHTCEENLGSCMSHCAVPELRRDATDCPEEEICCVLIRK